MSYGSQALICTTALVALLIFIIWADTLAFVPARQGTQSGRMISYAMLAAFVIVPMAVSPNYSRRPDELVQQGLSSQNVAQAVTGIAAFAWAVWLLVTRAISPSALMTGLSFWVGLTIIIYFLSMLWSIWPGMTAYRALELAGFWILTVHLFAGRPPLARLTGCLIAAVLLTLICGAIFGWPEYQPLIIFGRLRSNQGGVMAGILVLLLSYRLLLVGERRSGVLLLPSLTVFVLFGSLGSSVALVLAIVTLLICRLSRRFGLFTELLVLTYVLSTFIFFSYELMHYDTGWQAWLASVKGQSQELLSEGTGRFPLWGALWEATRDNVFGYGFGAGDRLIDQLVPSGSVEFTPTNAENGYLSTWLSAGCLSVSSVAFLFVGAIFEAARRPYLDRAYMLPVIVFLITNDLAYRGVGGVFNTAWFVIMGLACAGPIPGAALSVQKLRHSHSLLRA